MCIHGEGAPSMFRGLQRPEESINSPVIGFTSNCPLLCVLCGCCELNPGSVEEQ